MLRAVAIPAPERRVSEYPHQLSGGMPQRVMTAMAPAGRSRLPGLAEPGRGRCPFAPRCPHTMDRCRQQVPPSSVIAAGHSAACRLLEPEAR